MGIATKSVSFSFNKIMCRQNEGVSMSSPLGPILAYILLGSKKDICLKSFLRPSFIFVMCMILLFSLNHVTMLLLFFDKLNELHSSLTFTVEEENDNKLPFLDVLVERCDSSFLTSVYRKPTFTGLYLSWDSFSHRSRKLVFPIELEYLQ